VTVLAFHAYADARLAGASALTAGGRSNPVVNRDEQILTIMLLTLAVVNAPLFKTWAMVLGARTRQVSPGLVFAQTSVRRGGKRKPTIRS